MFEHWSERRRRWFLIAFNATAWLLFSNALAYLGSSFADGGIGPAGTTAVSLIGVAAAWTLLAAAFKLRCRHYVFALLFGLGLGSLLTEIGFDRHVAAGIWALGCDDGNGTACHNLAEYYDGGASPIGGSLDSGPLHRRACELGGPDTAESCAVARSLGLHTQAGARPTSRDCDNGARSACLAVARRLEASGDLEAAYTRYADACRLTRPGDSIEGCSTLLDSGYRRRRLAACETLDTVCATSAARSCVVAKRRCDRARSPHAGVSP